MAVMTFPTVERYTTKADGTIEKYTNSQLIKKGYNEKIGWYKNEIKRLEKKSLDLLEESKKEKQINIVQFMRDAEKIAIDIENHNTIIRMLSDQYEHLFQERPKEIDFSNLEVL